mgnify:CR=1 FL=1
MRQKKNRKKKKNRKIRILTGVVLGVGLAGALFFNVFKIRNIQVAGNTRYTKDEIKEMVADDKWMKNTVLLTTFHSKVDMSDIPFMNSVEFTFVSYDTICIQVNEKKVVGYVEYEGQKVYFDKNGIVLECVDEEQETPAEGEEPPPMERVRMDPLRVSRLHPKAVRPTVRSRRIRLKVHV